MSSKDQFVKKVLAMDGEHNVFNVWDDLMKCFANTIANSSTLTLDATWHKREAEVVAIQQKYTPRFVAECFALTVQAMQEEKGDCLGEIFMGIGLGNKQKQQYFTPFAVAQAMAALSMGELVGRKRIHQHEPTCGSGVMVIGAARYLEDAGVNYQRVLDVVCQDLDWRAVWMCYVQLSLLGISAVVCQGDTLTEPDWRTFPKERVFLTPQKRGLLL